MKKMLMTIFCTCFLCQSVFALLPPLYQDAAEIKAILSSDKLGNTLTAGEMIQTIQKTENGYAIYTRDHELDVEIKYLPANRPGPAQFDLIFHDPIPRNGKK